MLHVLLLVLKIIGIVVLCILGLLLLAVSLVLLVPVRYRVMGSWHGELRARAKVTWLLHALSVSVTYDDGGLSYLARVLGFRILSSEEDEAYEEFEEFEEQMETMEAPGETGAGPNEETGLGEETKVNRIGASEEGPADHAPTEPANAERAADEAGPARRNYEEEVHGKARRESLGRRITQRIRYLFSAVDGKLKAVVEKRDLILAFLRDADNQRTLKLIWRQVRRLLRHLLPTKVSADLVLGFDDPATTGKILSYLSIPQAWYGDSIQITPVFDHSVIEADVDVTGRIRAGSILVLGIRILLDRNFRILLKKWRTYGGKRDGRS